MNNTAPADSLQTGINLSTRILLAGIGLGILADLFLFDTEVVGAGLFLWLLCFSLAAAWLARLCPALSTLATGASISIVLTAAALLLLRSNAMVILSSTLIIFTTAALLLMQSRGLPPQQATVEDQLRFAFALLRQALLGCFAVFRDLDMSALVGNARLRAASRGALLALPALFIFSLLFSSADAGFSRLASALVESLSEDLLARLALIAAVAWLCCGLLAALEQTDNPAQSKTLRLLRLGTTDTAVFLGLVVALFLLFVGFQLNYLFGGRETIEAVAGLTVAEYARRGFFELLLVVALSLAFLLLTANACGNNRVFRILALAHISCVLLILLSALQRLALYMNSFGLSIDRLFAAAILIWLAVSLLCLACCVYRDRLTLFAPGLVLSALLTAFGFGLINPASLVAEINIDRSLENRQALDSAYLLSLGSDAVPTLVRRLQELPLLTRCQASRGLLALWSPGTSEASKDWRNWNLSLQRAQQAVANRRLQLENWSEYCRLPGRRF
jgi:hypothetical protein